MVSTLDLRGPDLSPGQVIVLCFWARCVLTLTVSFSANQVASNLLLEVTLQWTIIQGGGVEIPLVTLSCRNQSRVQATLYGPLGRNTDSTYFSLLGTLLKPSLHLVLSGLSFQVLNSNRSQPIFGICMGNQLTGLAAGAKTYKLPLGNRLAKSFLPFRIGLDTITFHFCTFFQRSQSARY